MFGCELGVAAVGRLDVWPNAATAISAPADADDDSDDDDDGGGVGGGGGDDGVCNNLADVALVLVAPSILFVSLLVPFDSCWLN